MHGLGGEVPAAAMIWRAACDHLRGLVPRLEAARPSSAGPAMQDEVEIVVLHHQLKDLQRQIKGGPCYKPTDRALLPALSRLLPLARWKVLLVKPETLLRWHRGFSAALAEVAGADGRLSLKRPSG